MLINFEIPDRDLLRMDEHHIAIVERMVRDKIESRIAQLRATGLGHHEIMALLAGVRGRW